MSTFTVTPEVAYNISIGAPGIAGTPTPTVSYAWTYNGTAIGTNSRFVNNYTFPSFPGTLACTITLTNIVGSVSQTVSATIQQASNLPTLSAVTIRDNAAPTVPITTIANGNAGVVLRVGGPSAADINPVASNASGIAFQWRRGAENISGATNQTYTLTASDEDSTIAVVVTVSNPDGTVSRSTAVTVGAPTLRVPRGDHMNPVESDESGITFANLIYSSVSGVAGVGYPGWVGRGVAGGNESERFGNAVDWSTAPEICTADGWPYRSVLGNITESQPCRTALSLSVFRLWSALELPIAWDGVAITTGEPGNHGFIPPDSILGKRYKYDVSVYWEGNGYAWVTSPEIPLQSGEAKPLKTSVVFAQSPFDDGRSNVPFTKTTRTLKYPISEEVRADNYGGGRILANIEETDPNNVDPLRNMIVLISNVREVDAEGNTINVVYEGFDETNYTPFALYPAAKERYQNASQLRSLQLEHARSERKYYDNSLTCSVTGQTRQEMNANNLNLAERPVHKERVAATLHGSGAELGWRAIDRPTHSGFGRSLRAMIEVCNQCGCDLYWCHPYAVVEVGTPTENGVILANSAPSLEGGWNPPDVSDPTQAGRVLVNQEYIDWFVETTALLNPGLKVYSEYANECWNNKAAYNIQHFYSYNMVQRIIAEPQYGGDGDVLQYRGTLRRTIGQSGRFPGTSIVGVQDRFGLLMSIIAGAHIAKALRESNMSRELVAVAGMWHARPGTSYDAMERAFALQPYLVKHIDALATAPYMSASCFYLNAPGEALFDTRAEELVSLGGWEAAWEYQINENKVHLPWTDSESYWVMDTNAPNTSRMRRVCARAKEVALDNGFGDHGTYIKNLPVGWPASRRRWNCKAITYEMGSETFFDEWNQAPIAIRLEAQSQTLEFHTHPGQQLFNRRYHEMLFSPSTKGETTDAVPGSDDEAMFMPGRVPADVVSNAEPIFDVATHLLSVQGVGRYRTVIWSEQLCSRHDSPSHRGVRDAIQRGVGLPNWWVNYDYGA